jgi:hypothetical protein
MNSLSFRSFSPSEVYLDLNEHKTVPGDEDDPADSRYESTTSLLAMKGKCVRIRCTRGQCTTYIMKQRPKDRGIPPLEP